MTTLIILRLIYEFYFRFPHFRIIRAEMKEWIYIGSEKITTYQIKIKTRKSSAELIFEEVWINEKRYRFQLTRENMRVAGSFTEKELLNLNILSEVAASDSTSQPEKSSKGRLVVAYTFRNKKKYMFVKKFKQIENLHFAA